MASERGVSQNWTGDEGRTLSPFGCEAPKESRQRLRGGEKERPKTDGRNVEMEMRYGTTRDKEGVVTERQRVELRAGDLVPPRR